MDGYELTYILKPKALPESEIAHLFRVPCYGFLIQVVKQGRFLTSPGKPESQNA